MEGEFTLSVRSLQQLEKLSTKDSTQNGDMDEERLSTLLAAFAMNPAGPVGRNPATCHDTMEMDVPVEPLSPRVQHGQDAEFCTEMLGIRPQETACLTDS